MNQSTTKLFVGLDVQEDAIAIAYAPADRGAWVIAPVRLAPARVQLRVALGRLPTTVTAFAGCRRASFLSPSHHVGSHTDDVPPRCGICERDRSLWPADREDASAAASSVDSNLCLRPGWARATWSAGSSVSRRRPLRGPG